MERRPRAAKTPPCRNLTKYKGGYDLIPRGIWRVPGLTIASRLVLGRLTCMANRKGGLVWAGGRALASALGIAPNTARGALAELEAAGLISRTGKMVGRSRERRVNWLVLDALLGTPRKDKPVVAEPAEPAVTVPAPGGGPGPAMATASAIPALAPLSFRSLADFAAMASPVSGVGRPEEPIPPSPPAELPAPVSSLGPEGPGPEDHTYLLSLVPPKGLPTGTPCLGREPGPPGPGDGPLQALRKFRADVIWDGLREMGQAIGRLGDDESRRLMEKAPLLGHSREFTACVALRFVQLNALPGKGAVAEAALAREFVPRAELRRREAFARAVKDDADAASVEAEGKWLWRGFEATRCLCAYEPSFLGGTAKNLVRHAAQPERRWPGSYVDERGERLWFACGNSALDPMDALEEMAHWAEGEEGRRRGTSREASAGDLFREAVAAARAKGAEMAASAREAEKLRQKQASRAVAARLRREARAG